LYAAFGHVSLIYNKHKHSNSIHSDNFLSSPLSFDSFLDTTTGRVIRIIIIINNNEKYNDSEREAVWRIEQSTDDDGRGR
jgi:hypothetical protein